MSLFQILSSYVYTEKNITITSVKIEYKNLKACKYLITSYYINSLTQIDYLLRAIYVYLHDENGKAHYMTYLG